MEKILEIDNFSPSLFDLSIAVTTVTCLRTTSHEVTGVKLRDLKTSASYGTIKCHSVNEPNTLLNIDVLYLRRMV